MRHDLRGFRPSHNTRWAKDTTPLWYLDCMKGCQLSALLHRRLVTRVCCCFLGFDSCTIFVTATQRWLERTTVQRLSVCLSVTVVNTEMLPQKCSAWEIAINGETSELQAVRILTCAKPVKINGSQYLSLWRTRSWWQWLPACGSRLLTAHECVEVSKGNVALCTPWGCVGGLGL